jgi:hypothetical protein
MNEEQLARNLQSIGMQVFVKYFDVFSSNRSREDVIEVLKSSTNYSEKSCVSRTGHARAILAAGLGHQALNIVVASDSPRISKEIRALAQELAKVL